MMRGFIRMSGVAVLIGMLAACSSVVKVTYTACQSSDYDGSLSEVALIPIIEKSVSEKKRNWFFHADSEVTGLLRRQLERSKKVDIKVSLLQAKTLPEALQPILEWRDLEEKDPVSWVKYRKYINADLLLLGFIEFDADSHEGFVTETYEDPYYHRPTRRTVKKTMTTYKYRLDLYLLDLHNGDSVRKKMFEREETVEGKTSVYEFLRMIEPDLITFLEPLLGEERLEHRLLLK